MSIQELLDDQRAIELPAREMLAFTINLTVPVAVQTNLSIQLCGIGYQSTGTCNAVQINIANNWYNS